MQIVIDIPEEDYEGICHLKNEQLRMLPVEVAETLIRIANGIPIPNDATNGDMIKAMFGADKVFGFIHYVHLMAKVGNWFNEGAVAEFDKDWWDEPYKKGGKE